MEPINVYVLLDMTSSMFQRKQATLDAVNEYLQGVKDQEGLNSPMVLSLGVFNAAISLEKIYSSQPIEQVGLISHEQYKPDSVTPLYDAIGQAIEDLDQRTGPKLLVIQTDGEENSSQRFSKDQIVQMIAERSQDGWQFLYLGCDLDAMDQAKGIGIGSDQTLSYDNHSTRAAYSTLAQTTSSFSASRGKSQASLGGKDLRRKPRTR